MKSIIHTYPSRMLKGRIVSIVRFSGRHPLTRQSSSSKQIFYGSQAQSEVSFCSSEWLMNPSRSSSSGCRSPALAKFHQWHFFPAQRSARVAPFVPGNNFSQRIIAPSETMSKWQSPCGVDAFHPAGRINNCSPQLSMRWLAERGKWSWPPSSRSWGQNVLRKNIQGLILELQSTTAALRSYHVAISREINRSW